ncbi:MAG: sulfatase/phosphatase domain-containing protein, partial [Saprospiraceae bacterium]
QAGDTTYTWQSGKTATAETPIHISKDIEFPIPPYLPDTEFVRRDMWKIYNNIAEMDKQVGAVLDQLEADSLLDKTIIIFYGDHGGPLPRQKRLIYDSGLNTPMIVRFPNQEKAGSKDEQLVSFIDFAPTLLSIIGVQPPQYMQGQAFLGKSKAQTERKYIHAAADRFDGFTDVIRAVRDQRFKYIRNYRPQQGYYLPVEYRERIPTMQELLRLRQAGQLDSIQAQWFRPTKSPEELFDCQTDPHELNNLASDPAYKAKLQELRTEMDRWLIAIGDNPDLPENELVKQLWNGQNVQPVTAYPVITTAEGKVSISCPTEGASIGYKVIGEDEKISDVWMVYEEPFVLTKSSQLFVEAHRIGYVRSGIIEEQISVPK